MKTTFNALLSAAGLELSQVRLLRHADPKRSKPGQTPYDLWRRHRMQFEAYQSLQAFHDRSRLDAPYWTSFVAAPDGRTIFVGLYSAKYIGVFQTDRKMPNCDDIDKAGSCDEYALSLTDFLAEHRDTLAVEWGRDTNRGSARQLDKPICC